VSSSACCGFVSTFKYWHEMSDEKRHPDSPRIELPVEHDVYLNDKVPKSRNRSLKPRI